MPEGLQSTEAWSLPDFGEVPIPVSGGHATVHQDVGAGDERPSDPISSAPTPPTSSGAPARPAADAWIIRRYPSLRGPASSSLASGVMIIPGLIVFTRAPRFPPANRLGHHAKRVRAFDSW